MPDNNDGQEDREEQEELMRLLAEMQRDDDPVPSSVRDMAANIPGIQRLDADLAEIIEHEALVREGEATLAFQSGQTSMLVEVDGTSVTVDVLGSDPNRVELETASGERHPLSENAGAWRLHPGIAAGPARIVVTVRAGHTVATPWFTVSAQP